MPRTVAVMDPSNILVAGVGGIGCAWAQQAHEKCRGGAHLVLIDADEASFKIGEDIHVLRLGHALDSVGCAALPPLAEQRMRGLSTLANQLLQTTELVILLTGLGGRIRGPLPSQHRRPIR